MYIYTPRTTQPLSALFRKAAPAVSSNFGSLEDLKRRAECNVENGLPPKKGQKQPTKPTV